MPNTTQHFSYGVKLAAAVLLAAGVLGAPAATADIILDEFVDVAMVESPVLRNFFVETPNVGDLHAQRRIRIAAAGTDPVGSMDIGVTTPGQLTAHIDRLDRTDNLTPQAAIQFWYRFDPTDVTAGGKNDVIYLDLAELRGEVQPIALRVFAWDNTDLRSSFLAELFPLIANDSPHTLAVPFEAFTLRTGAPGLPDPTTLRQIHFSLWFFGASQTGQLDWSVRLERIRFGPAVVPEAGSLPMALLAIVTSFCFLRFDTKGVRRWSNGILPRLLRNL